MGFRGSRVQIPPSRFEVTREGTGILLLASSVSGTSTTAYELCTIFEAMDIMDGAVRVDGGPSAAIF